MLTNKIIQPNSVNFNIPEGAVNGTLPGLLIPDPFTATFQLNPPLTITDGALIDIANAAFPYTQPNIAAPGELPAITNGNNRVTIQWNGVGYDFLLPTGLYSYPDVQYQLNAFAAGNGWCNAGTNLFVLTGINSTQQLVITVIPTVINAGAWGAAGTIPPNTRIIFTNPSPVSGLNDSIGEVLGFPTVGGGSILILTPGTTPQAFTSPNAADFATISAYILNCSLVSGSYINGTTGQLLYSFPLASYTPNSSAAFQATFRYPVPAFPGTHSRVSFFFTDNSGNRLPLRFFQGPVSISFIISHVKADGSL